MLLSVCLSTCWYSQGPDQPPPPSAAIPHHGVVQRSRLLLFPDAVGASGGLDSGRRANTHQLTLAHRCSASAICVTILAALKRCPSTVDDGNPFSSVNRSAIVALKT